MKTRMLNGYRVIYKPDSLSAMKSDNWKGWIYEHIWFAEQSLGRQIKATEIVHHLNCDRSNNRIENLLVIEKSQHAKLHAWIDKEYKTKPPTYCAVCDISLQNTQETTCSIACVSNLRKSRRKVERPSKLRLRIEIASNSWLSLGRKYGVSDNAIRKWARSYGLL